MEQKERYAILEMGVGHNHLHSLLDGEMASPNYFINPKNADKIKKFIDAWDMTYEPLFYSIRSSIENLLGYEPSSQNFIRPDEKQKNILQENLSKANSIFIAASFINPRLDCWSNQKILEELERAMQSKKDLGFIISNELILDKNGHNPFFEFLMEQKAWNKLNLRVFTEKYSNIGIPFRAEIFDTHVIYFNSQTEHRCCQTKVDCGNNPYIAKMIKGFYDTLEKNGKLKKISSNKEMHNIKLRQLDYSGVRDL